MALVVVPMRFIRTVVGGRGSGEAATEWTIAFTVVKRELGVVFSGKHRGEEIKDGAIPRRAGPIKSPRQ